MKIKNFFKRHTKIWATVLAIGLSILIFVFRNQFIRLQGLGLTGLFILSIIGNATIIFPVPVVITAFVGGAIFNPFLVALVISFGATLGELTGYFAGYGAEDLISSNQKMKKIDSYMKKYGLWVLFVLAAVPNPLFDLAGIVAGATEIPIRKYLLVVWLGKLVKFGSLALIGSRLI